MPYEELSRRAEVGQLIPRKDLIENKVRAEKAKLTIESLQGQLELFNELSKGLIKDETTEQDPKTEPSKSITPDQ